MRKLHSSGSWLLAMALAGAYVLVPGCMSDPAPTDDPISHEAAIEQLICQPCPGLPIAIVIDDGVVAPHCQA